MAFYSYLIYVIFMNEKFRKKTRFQANFDGYFRLRYADKWQDCYIYDISESGTLLRIKQTLVVGDELEICLDINNTNDVIVGTVANVQGQVAGIEFKTKNINLIVDRAIERAFEEARKDKKKGF